MDIESDFRNLATDVRKLERGVERMRYALEGETGKGGLMNDLREITEQQAKIIANQDATTNLIRVGFWVMAMASALAIFLSLTAIVIAVMAFMKA